MQLALGTPVVKVHVGVHRLGAALPTHPSAPQLDHMLRLVCLAVWGTSLAAISLAAIAFDVELLRRSCTHGEICDTEQLDLADLKAHVPLWLSIT